ncbi:MAG: hypothetical protein AAGC55_25155 [Myxococcota bacterium]
MTELLGRFAHRPGGLAAARSLAALAVLGCALVALVACPPTPRESYPPIVAPPTGAVPAAEPPDEPTAALDEPSAPGEPVASAGPGEPAEPASGETAREPAADGAACLSAADCASGLCEGQGCGAEQPGVCVPAQRACTRDLVPFCGCDGQTFRSSSRCPGRRYSQTGKC